MVIGTIERGKKGNSISIKQSYFLGHSIWKCESPAARVYSNEKKPFLIRYLKRCKDLRTDHSFL